MFMGRRTTIESSQRRLDARYNTHRRGPSEPAPSKHAAITEWLKQEPDDRLTHAVFETIDAAGGGDVDGLLDRCEACLASLPVDAPNAVRACLVKRALAASLHDRQPDAWTEDQLSRLAALHARVQLDFLSVQLFAELPAVDWEPVLRTAVEQAGESPFWPERLLQLTQLCLDMQDRWSAGLPSVRAVLSYVGDALKVLCAPPSTAESVRARCKVDRCWNQAMLAYLKATLKAQNLWSVAQAVSDLRSRGDDRYWTHAEGVMDLLWNRLHEVGLSFDWMSREFCPVGLPVDGDAVADPKRQLQEVARALTVLGKMGLLQDHPSGQALEAWFEKHMGSEAGRAAALDLLCDAAVEPELKPLLLDALLRLDPSPESGLDGLWPIVLRLAKAPQQIALYLTQVRNQKGPQWRGPKALLSFCQALSGEPYSIMVDKGMPQDVVVRTYLQGIGLGAVGEDERLDRVAFFRDLWLASAVNGKPCGGAISSLFLRRDQAERIQAMWSAEWCRSLVDRLAPATRQALTPIQQEQLVLRHLVRVAIQDPDSLRVLVGDDALSPHALAAFAYSVDESVRRMVQRWENTTPDASMEAAWLGSLGRLWAQVSTADPQWLNAVMDDHPWMEQAIAIARDDKQSEEFKGMAIADLVIAVAKQRHIQGDASRVQ